MEFNMEAIRNLSDSELVAGLRSGSRMDDAVKTIYRNYFDGSRYYVMNNNGSRQDAEDIFQEVVVTFIELVQKDKFRGESSIRTFLFSLTRHLWLNELKRKGRAMTREVKYEKAQEKAEMDIAQAIGHREGRQQVNDLIERLGDACKKILIMFYYEDIPVRDMLGKLDYENEQVIRNKKYKCMKQLEDMIAGDPILRQTLKNLLNG
jgi:RNA polymerase sigma factor (sigma-70 family)